jgi:hypothetical protein
MKIHSTHYLIIILIIGLAAFYFLYGATTVLPYFTRGLTGISSPSGGMSGESPPPQTHTDCGPFEPNWDGTCTAIFEPKIDKAGYLEFWSGEWGLQYNTQNAKDMGKKLLIKTTLEGSKYHTTRAFLPFIAYNFSPSIMIVKAVLNISRKSVNIGSDDRFYIMSSNREPPFGGLELSDWTECGPPIPEDKYALHPLIIAKNHMPKKDKVYSFPLKTSGMNFSEEIELCFRTYHDAWAYQPDQTPWANKENIVELNKWAELKPVLEVVFKKDPNKHTTCSSSGQCVVVTGPGNDECFSNEDCVHTECDYMTCTQENSPGEDKCSTNEDCWHMGCSNYQCMKMQSWQPGQPDICSTNEDCSYMGCDYYNFTCEKMQSYKPNQTDECSTNEECWHMGCDYYNLTCGKMISWPPGQPDTCSTNEECWHMGCDYQNLTCGKMYSWEPNITDDCSTNEDCWHLECDYFNLACEKKYSYDPGQNDTCSTNEDCWHMGCDYQNLTCGKMYSWEPNITDSCSTNEDCWHMECNFQNLTCGKVISWPPGKNDSCSTNEDCWHMGCDYQNLTCGKMYSWEPNITDSSNEDCWHLGCSYQNLTCEKKYSYQPNQTDDCSTNEECFYMGCKDMQCQALPGLNVNDTCSTNEECWRMGCDSNNQCTQVPGMGPDTCNTSQDCYHMDCNSQNQCVQTGGQGPDMCQTNQDCYHLDCVSMQCVLVPGHGWDMCKTSQDCDRDLIVFVTESFGSYGGFGQSPEEALSHADLLCELESWSKGLTGSFKAWMSTDNVDAINRIAGGRYINEKAQPIASSKADLTDGTIQNPIDVSGNQTYVWTGTKSDGTASTDNCEEWTVSSSSSALVGLSDKTDKGWTENKILVCGYSFLPIYCFEVEYF